MPERLDIQCVPAADFRVDTGPVQFGEDWPGYFIRGDNAAYLADTFETIAVLLDASNSRHQSAYAKFLREWAAKLLSSRIDARAV